jgi:hypothetical protein
LLLLALLALGYGVSREPDQLLILLCCGATVLAAIAALLGLWALGYRRLAYALSESALCVEWLGRNIVVPYAAIQGIYAGQRLAGNSTPSVPRWPGISIGPRRVRGLGKLRFFATSSDQSQLTLITVEHGGLVVSARDPAEFQTALIERVERSDAGLATWFDKEPVDAPWTAVADRWLPTCVAIGALALLITVATIGSRYPDLPAQIPLHFDVGGEPSQIGPKSDLLHLPLLGLFCLMVNWVLGVAVHPRARVLARVLWLVAIAVQLVLLIGLVRIVA